MELMITVYMLIINFCRWIDTVSLGHIILTGIKIVVVLIIAYIVFYVAGTILIDLLDMFDNNGKHKK